MSPRPFPALRDVAASGGDTVNSTSDGHAAFSAWLADDATVQRVLRAKRSYPPSRSFWPRLAALAQLVAAIIDAPTRDLAQRLDRAATLVAELMAELPTPTVAPWDPRYPGPLWSARWRGWRPIEDLTACVTALAAFLLDPLPSSLDALAVVLDELAITVWMARQPQASRRIGQATR